MLPHRVLIDEAAIQARVEALAKSIARDLEGRPVLVLGLLTGSFMFVADLARALARQGIEPRVAFLRASHYGVGTDAARPVRLEESAPADLAGQAVLIVDDILDSGETLATVVARIRASGPAWLRVCVLLDKPSTRAAGLEADYVGFTVPDLWLIGYGLDLDGQGRALPYVGAVEDRRDASPPVLEGF